MLFQSIVIGNLEVFEGYPHPYLEKLYLQAAPFEW